MRKKEIESANRPHTGNIQESNNRVSRIPPNVLQKQTQSIKLLSTTSAYPLQQTQTNGQESNPREVARADFNRGGAEDTQFEAAENNTVNPQEEIEQQTQTTQQKDKEPQLEGTINYPNVPDNEKDPRVRINVMIKQFNDSLKVRYQQIDCGLYHEIQTAMHLVGNFKIVHGKQISRGLTKEEKNSCLNGDSQNITTPTENGKYREIDFVFDEDEKTNIVEAKNTASVDTHQVDKNKKLAQKLGGKVIYALAGNKDAQMNAIKKKFQEGESLEIASQQLEFITIPADEFGRLYNEGIVAGLGYIPTLKQIMDESFNVDSGAEYDEI
ncbi:hypothetical protein [Nostoc sp.]|uniref:hypothetical protein n=1 Tax=Nostoc sp. TaxID=1180 RepID=UPI002FFBFA58